MLESEVKENMFIWELYNLLAII